jgi:hypothetical protein
LLQVGLEQEQVTPLVTEAKRNALGGYRLILEDWPEIDSGSFSEEHGEELQRMYTTGYDSLEQDRLTERRPGLLRRQQMARGHDGDSVAGRQED